MAIERLTRWRLVLGGADPQCPLDGRLASVDRALAALYGGEEGQGREGDGKARSAGLGASAPRVARWLGDIREFFPKSVVQVMQKDAMARLNLPQMLLEPELLEALEPDVHLVTTLISLGRVMPAKAKASARQVVQKVVSDLERRLRARTVQAVRGALARASRTSRPRPSDIDWHRTIRKNLKTYDPARKTLVPERLVGLRRAKPGMRDVVLCVDQSGSMAPSVVYSGVFAAVLASLPALRTRLVCFDTALVDLTDQLADPVEVLFGTQLGGGTDINRALAHCEQLVTRPQGTVLVLITDLYEGGDAAQMLARAARLHASGVRMVCLLALSDDGAPSYDPRNAGALAAIGIPAFACTPDLFPDLMAAALQGEDLGLWAARHDLTTAGRERC